MTNILNMPSGLSDATEPVWAQLMEDPSLQSIASELWHETIKEMRGADTFAPINLFEIKRYVLFMTMFDAAMTKAFKEGAVIRCTSKDDVRFNPYWSVAKDCDTFASQHEEKLGLTPRRRAQVTPAKKGKTKTGADQFLAKVG